MTTKKYADFIEKQTRNVINVSTEPIFGEYIIRVNGKKIGVLYQNQCYLLLTGKGKELLPNADICRPYKNSPGEKDFIEPVVPSTVAYGKCGLPSVLCSRQTLPPLEKQRSYNGFYHDPPLCTVLFGTLAVWFVGMDRF